MTKLIRLMLLSLPLMVCRTFIIKVRKSIFAIIPFCIALILSYSPVLLVTLGARTAESQTIKQSQRQASHQATNMTSSQLKGQNGQGRKPDRGQDRSHGKAKSESQLQPLFPEQHIPEKLVALRAQKVLEELKKRPLRVNSMVSSVDRNSESKSVEIQSSLSKTGWLDSVYQTKMVEASIATEVLSDKRILAEVMERILGAKAQKFYPRTIGLREFLVKRKLLDAKGVIRAESDTIEEALSEEFPAGFIVRPAVGVAPGETGHGLYVNTEHFIEELLKPKSRLYQSSHFVMPVKSHILNSVASGEAVVLQENFINVVAISASKNPLKSRFFQEVRIHTYEDRVVEGAVPDRWVQTNLLTQEQIQHAEAFVREFLLSIPISILTRQAWGIDVAVLDNGELRIIDIVTNRGKRIAWSSYLDQPRIIAAYAKHFERHYGIHLTGLNGMLIRRGFANYFPFWDKRIEMAPKGVKKALAFLPPMP